MSFRSLIISLSALLLVISVSLFLPALVAIYYGEMESLNSFLIVGLVGVLFFSLVIFLTPRRSAELKLSTKDGYLLVTLGWILAAALSAIPYHLSGFFETPFDSYFEAMSGLTTTGATVLNDIEALPKSLLFWRAETHWLGGMGIIVLTVALLPLLGVGGYQLMKAEAPGPDIDRITHRITHTAKILWLIYIGITVLEIGLLKIGGMSFYDSVTHAFATVSTGGFSPKGESVGAYDSPYLQWIITIFMVISGANFMIYFYLLKKNISNIRKNEEFKVYLLIVIIASLLIAFFLQRETGYSFSKALRYASFQVASIMTTTGFATADYIQWSYAAQAILFLMMFVGGSTGSTGGGIKVLRWLLVVKQIRVELYTLTFPKAVFRNTLNRQLVRASSLFPILGFIALYFMLLFATTLVTALHDYDLLTSFSTALATLGNIGPGFGAIGPMENFNHFAPFLKAFYSFIMMAGRLEIFTVMAVFMPRFWRY